MNTEAMKKVIAVPAGRWARELLTLAGAERIEYFLDDDVDIQKTGFPTGNSIKPVYPISHIEDEDRDNIVIVIKPVYPISHIEDEDRDNIVIVITDSKRFAELRDRLVSFGLAENRHFFDGWHLDIGFYRMIGDGFTTWTQYEKSIGGFDYSEFSSRAGKMASMIPDDVTSIMDMGCGDEVLRRYLDPHIRYYGLDLVCRNADTIVCDIIWRDSCCISMMWRSSFRKCGAQNT